MATYVMGPSPAAQLHITRHVHFSPADNPALNVDTAAIPVLLQSTGIQTTWPATGQRFPRGDG